MNYSNIMPNKKQSALFFLTAGFRLFMRILPSDIKITQRRAKKRLEWNLLVIVVSILVKRISETRYRAPQSCGVQKYSRRHLILIISIVMFDLIKGACENQQLNGRIDGPTPRMRPSRIVMYSIFHRLRTL